MNKINNFKIELRSGCLDPFYIHIECPNCQTQISNKEFEGDNTDWTCTPNKEFNKDNGVHRTVFCHNCDAEIDFKFKINFSAEISDDPELNIYIPNK